MKGTGTGGLAKCIEEGAEVASFSFRVFKYPSNNPGEAYFGL
jgi:hypothetical protein